MHANQAHQIIDALSKDKYIYIAILILVIHLLMKQVNKHHDKLMTSRRIYDDHKSGKILDETPAETLTMIKKSFISIVVNLFSIISVTVLAACFFIYF
ncbi:hypothetical protein E8484_002354 [Escherichia coli]|nr:hypothetical protein [Escherichia coli]HAM9128228.1 hypothetical protein [Escherichia coli]